MDFFVTDLVVGISVEDGYGGTSGVDGEIFLAGVLMDHGIYFAS